MKKTISINLGGRIFYIEDDAYATLEQYLSDVKQHFATLPHSNEVITDIEDRMAEHFEQADRGKQDKIITKDDVEKLIAVMGTVQDFTESERAESKQAHTSPPNRRKLYRNTEDAILGGVASGIAAFFHWDPLWVRLAWVISVFFGGYTILLYIILWVIVPAAETESEKLEMKGSPVTLASLEKNIKEKIVDTKKMKDTARRTGAAFGEIGSRIGIIVGKVFMIAFKILGVLLGIAVAIAFFVSTFTLIAAIVTHGDGYMQFPFRDFLGPVQYYLALFGAYVIVAIPLVFLWFFAVRLSGKRNAFNVMLVSSMTIVWFAAATTVGIIAIKNAPRYEAFASSHPMLKMVEQTYTVESFTKIDAANDVMVFIEPGSPGVSARAIQSDLDRLTVESKDGTLHIKKRLLENFWCFFCINERPQVYITVPLLDEVTAGNAVGVKFENLIVNSVTLTAHNGSHLTGSLKAQELRINSFNASHMRLSGEAPRAEFRAENGSWIDATELVVEDAVARATNASHIKLNASKTLDAIARNGSWITYRGNPILLNKTEEGDVFDSRVKQETAESEQEEF